MKSPGEAAPFEQELLPELRRPLLAGMEPVVGGDVQLEVHADVDDHPYRPHDLSPQKPEAVIGVFEVPELVHQPFGVQRPALSVRPQPCHPLKTRKLVL